MPNDKQWKQEGLGEQDEDEEEGEEEQEEEVQEEEDEEEEKEVDEEEEGEGDDLDGEQDEPPEKVPKHASSRIEVDEPKPSDTAVLPPPFRRCGPRF